MPRPTKEQADEKEWDKLVLDAGYVRVEAALERAGLSCDQQGGLVVAIPDPDGARTRRYFLRLTEVANRD